MSKEFSYTARQDDFMRWAEDKNWIIAEHTRSQHRGINQHNYDKDTSSYTEYFIDTITCATPYGTIMRVSFKDADLISCLIVYSL